MSKNNLLKDLLIVFLFLSAQQAYSHPMGLAFCNLKYSNGVMSFSTRIFYADFYCEFQQTASVKNKDYVKKGIDKVDQNDLRKYFKKNIRIWADNKEVHFDTLSYTFERHEEDAYIFIVEMKGKAKIKDKSKIKISDAVLLNTIGGQKQIINVFLKDQNLPSHGIITLDKTTPSFEFLNE